MSHHGDRRGQIAAFGDSFETINWLYLLFKCGIKTKTHFEWLLWHWSSLGQLNLEPTRPNGLVGCKVPTDLVKINVKEATHMGFYNRVNPLAPVRCSNFESGFFSNWFRELICWALVNDQLRLVVAWCRPTTNQHLESWTNYDQVLCHLFFNISQFSDNFENRGPHDVSFISFQSRFHDWFFAIIYALFN